MDCTFGVIGKTFVTVIIVVPAPSLNPVMLVPLVIFIYVTSVVL